MDKKYLETQASVLVNLYTAKKFDEAVLKGKVLIKKFPDQIIFYGRQIDCANRALQAWLLLQASTNSVAKTFQHKAKHQNCCSHRQ